jgi:hypothetical protein
MALSGLVVGTVGIGLTVLKIANIRTPWVVFAHCVDVTGKFQGAIYEIPGAATWTSSSFVDHLNASSLDKTFLNPILAQLNLILALIILI